MRSRLFTILAATSLVLCVAAAVSWPERGGVVIWTRSDRLSWPTVPMPARPRSTTQRAVLNLLVVRFVETHACYEWDRTVEVPNWLAVAGSAALPAAWVRRKFRGGIGRSGRGCPSCGYDLRATPDRCPECGAVPTRCGEDGGEQSVHAGVLS